MTSNVSNQKPADHKSPVGKATENLLTQIGDLITIPPSTQKFIATEKLVVNTGNYAELKISHLGNNFKKCFLRKVEEAFAGSQLKIQKLSNKSVDGPILDELGGEEKAETTLYEMFESLKTAPHAWYIFHIKDASGSPRAVAVDWVDGGWSLSAGGLHGPDGWGADYHVVSRNFDTVSVST